MFSHNVPMLSIVCLVSCEGVHFQHIDDNQRVRIFDMIAGEFTARRARITRHLIGDKGLEKINLQRPQAVVGETEHELLYQAMNCWYKEELKPTGRKLFKALCWAGCEKRLLQSFQHLLGLAEETEHVALLPDLHIGGQLQRECKTCSQVTDGTDCTSSSEEKLRQKVAFLEQQKAAMEKKMQRVTRQRLHSRPLAARSWRPLPPMPGRKMCCRAVPVGNYIVIVGGFSGEDIACDDVYAFHTVTHRWDVWLSTPNALCAVASDGEDLYIAGGCPLNGGRAVRDVFKLSDDHNEWRLLPKKMPHRCCDAAATIFKRCLYVLGGEAAWKSDEVNRIAWSKVRPCPIDRPAHYLQIFNFEKKEWRLGHALLLDDPYTNNDCLLPYREKLICDRLHSYDTERDEWEEIPERTCSLTTTAMAVVEDSVLAVGGGYPGSEKTDMLLANDDGWQWKALPETRTSRRGAAATELHGFVYVAGGQSVYGDVLCEFEIYS